MASASPGCDNPLESPGESRESAARHRAHQYCPPGTPRTIRRALIDFPSLFRIGRTKEDLMKLKTRIKAGALIENHNQSR